MFRRKPDRLVGHAAPPFALPAQDEALVDLKAFRGLRRVILAFYREDDAPGCTHELRALDAARDRFAACRTEVLGISHNSVRSHARFAAREGLGLTLLADPDAAVARPYGVRGWLPFFKRRTVVIDGHGVVRVVQDGMPDVEDLLRLVDGFRGDLPEADDGGDGA